MVDNTRTCIICNKTIFAYGKRKKTAKYCSNECRWIDYKKRYSGSGNPSWKGGKRTNHNGYTLIYKPDHPYSTNNYVFEHRLVMEKKIGRYIGKHEIVHHINKDKSDNSIDNLQLLTHDNPTHPYYSVCPHCGKELNGKI